MKLRDINNLKDKYAVLEPYGKIIGPISNVYILDKALVVELKDYKFPYEFLYENDTVEGIVYYSEYFWQVELYRVEYYKNVDKEED